MIALVRKMVAVSSHFCRTANPAKMAEAVGLRRNCAQSGRRPQLLVATFVAIPNRPPSIGHIGAAFSRTFRRSFVAELGVVE